MGVCTKVRENLHNKSVPRLADMNSVLVILSESVTSFTGMVSQHRVIVVSILGILILSNDIISTAQVA